MTDNDEWAVRLRVRGKWEDRIEGPAEAEIYVEANEDAYR